jgi:hypothetical protein
MGLATSTVWAMAEPGPSRLIGYGLILIATAGFQPLVAHQILLAICGLFAMTSAAARQPLASSPSPAPTPAVAPAASV